MKRPTLFPLTAASLIALFACKDTTGVPRRLLAPEAPVFDYTTPPSEATIVGSLQSELGCSADWQPECAATHLRYDPADDVWQGTFEVPAGSWEYKVALDDSWNENYGRYAQRDGANILLSLGAPGAVKFYYDHKSHWVTTNRNAVIAVAPGSFQSKLGCPGDWDPGCLRSWLQDPDEDGTYTFVTNGIPAGSYEAKVAVNESWDENYGDGGVLNGPNIPFSVGTDNRVTFSYDAATHVLDITTESVNQPPVARAGGPYVGTEGSAVVFDGSRSSDPEGDAITFAWDFGDGGSGTGSPLTYTYADEGTFVVTLTVTDAKGLSATATTTATIANVPPTVGPIQGATILQGETFTSSGSFTDPGADTWTATVDYGDGSGMHPLPLSGKTFVLTHTYNAPGTFAVSVTVTDDDGTAGIGQASVIVQSPQQGAQTVVATVDALVQAGQVSVGNGTALDAKLRAAIAQLDRGNTTAAVNQLNAFISQVTDLISSGAISSGEGESLIDAARRIIQAIQNP